ncbi:MAG: HAD family phosphatase [Sphingomonadaceae bacterium]
MIEAVVFDVGRVLFQWQLRALFEKVEHDPDRLEFLLSEVVSEEWHFQHDRGRPLADMVAERKAQYPDYSAAIHAYATRFNETVPGPILGSLEIVADLDQAGVPLFAITNFGADLWAGFHPTQPIFNLFRDIVVSGEEEIAKPDPAIFALATERFGHDPAAMLFIDDNAVNVAGARACGWQAHHFINAQTLRSDLIRRGLLAG